MVTLRTDAWVRYKQARCWIGTSRCLRPRRKVGVRGRSTKKTSYTSIFVPPPLRAPFPSLAKTAGKALARKTCLVHEESTDRQCRNFLGFRLHRISSISLVSVHSTSQGSQPGDTAYNYADETTAQRHHHQNRYPSVRRLLGALCF